MIDLSPESHQDAYQWASTLLAHATVGLFFTSICGMMARSVWVAAAAVSIIYAVAWEGWWQGLGAGFADAVIDTFAVSCGAIVAAASWGRKGGAVAAALAGLFIAMWRGIRRRS